MQIYQYQKRIREHVRLMSEADTQAKRAYHKRKYEELARDLEKDYPGFLNWWLMDECFTTNVK